MDGIKKRSVLHSPHLVEIKKKKRRVAKSKAVFIFFGLFFILAILIFISRLENLSIQNIEIAGNKIIEKEVLEKSVWESLEGDYLWLIPKKNFLLYPEQSLKTHLEEKFKRIKDISIELKDTKTLLVQVQERGIEHTYCGESLDNEKEQCYFLDQNGYIFDEAPSFSGAVYLKFFGRLSGNSEALSPLGKQFMQGDFAKVAQFIENLESMGLSPHALNLKEDDEIEVYLGNIEASEKPKLILKKEDDFEKLSQNLASAIATAPLSTNLKEKFNDLLYIDLRFGNKVYYKFK